MKRLSLKARETLNEVDIHSRHVNCIRLHKNTTLKHRNKICEICNWLLDNNYSFITEAKFKDGGRADIVILEEGVAYEVMDSERKKVRTKQYPIPTYYIGVDEEWKGL